MDSVRCAQKYCILAIFLVWQLQERPPYVLLTTTYKPSKVMYHFLADLLDVSRRALYSLAHC